MLHVLVGDSTGDPKALFATTNGKKAVKWIVPKTAQAGDDAVFYLPTDGFVAFGTIADDPQPTERSGWYSAPVNQLTLLPAFVPLAFILANHRDWKWATYPRTYTTVKGAVETRLRELLNGYQAPSAAPSAQMRRTRRGWLYSLKHNPDTNWGSIDSFYEDIGTEVRPDGQIHVKSDVRGRIRGDELPAPGDGFAFYHSSKARFPSPDRFRRSPRISLVGKLLDVRFDGRALEWISVAIDPSILAAMMAHPIVRDDATKPIFERSGLVPGIPYALYPVEPDDWLRIEAFIQPAPNNATGDENNEDDIILDDLADLDRQFASDVAASWSLSDSERAARMARASRHPEPVEVFTTVFRRNPDVVVEVLKRANGVCERCRTNAPFLRRSDGSPFLEVHHWHTLADGGEDTVQNAVALCPNCHRELHHG